MLRRDQGRFSRLFEQFPPPFGECAGGDKITYVNASEQGAIGVEAHGLRFFDDAQLLSVHPLE